MYPKKSFVVCSKVPLNLTLNRHLQLLATSWKILAQIIKMVAAVQWVILKQWSRYELCVSQPNTTRAPLCHAAASLL